MYELVPTIPPAIEPVTLAETKDHLRIEPSITEDDDLIEAMIPAARRLAETAMHRKLITQTWALLLECFPGSSYWNWQYNSSWSWQRPAANWYRGYELELPVSPVQSIAAVSYYDTTDALQFMPSTDYEVGMKSGRPKIRPVQGAFWPATYYKYGAVQIDIVAGYGDVASAIHDSIKLWIKCAVAAMYEQREIVLERGNLQMSTFIDGYLDPFRLIQI